MTLRDALLRGRRRPRTVHGGSPTVFRADGYEFAELREYVVGDDPRRIDWAATARAGVLQTRVMLEDIGLHLSAIIDTSASMRVGRHRTLLEAAHEAVQAWYDVASSEDRCMRILSSGVFSPPALRGRAAARACTGVADDAPLRLETACAVARVAMPPGAALLVISDFYKVDVAATAMAALGARFDCTALIARDPWLSELPLRGFVRVGDAESNECSVLYFGERERLQYRDAAAARERGVAKALAARGWRTGSLSEADGAASLRSAFGIG